MVGRHNAVDWATVSLSFTEPIPLTSHTPQEYRLCPMNDVWHRCYIITLWSCFHSCLNNCLTETISHDNTHRQEYHRKYQSLVWRKFYFWWVTLTCRSNIGKIVPPPFKIIPPEGTLIKQRLHIPSTKILITDNNND
jgi:hypothetical protein